MAGKSVKLEFDVGLTDGSGQKIRDQLESILRGIGTEGLELQSLRVNASAISKLRSDIQNSLKDIPITFKASDISTVGGVITKGATSTLKPIRAEMNTLLSEYEKAMKNWKSARLDGKDNQAKVFAQEAKEIASRYKEMAAANKNVISQEEALSRLAEKRSQIVRETTAALRDQYQGKEQLKATGRAEAAQAASSTRQIDTQKQLNKLLDDYASKERAAQDAALGGRGASNATVLSQQAKDAAAEYEKLANSIENAEERQRALSNLAQTQKNIILDTSRMMDSQQAKSEEKSAKDIQTQLDKQMKEYTTAMKQLESARANGKAIDETAYEMKASNAAEKYRELANSIEDVNQREAALNALDQTRQAMVEAGTAVIERNTQAERDNAEAKEQKQAAAQMTSDISGQIGLYDRMTQSLIKSTEAYRNWQAAQAGFADGSVSFAEFTAAGEEMQRMMEGLATASPTIGSKLGKFFGTISGRLQMAGFMYATRAIREMINAVKDLDSSVTQMQIVTGGTDSDMQRFSMNIAQTAKDIGSSITDLVDSATVFARLGYTEGESTVLSKFTSMLSNVGDIDVGTAQKAITAIVKAYGMGVEDVEGVMDRMVDVGNHFPISVAEIAQGMTNAGSTLKVAGNDIEQSIALLTAANTSVQDVSKASTGLRTIAARLRRSQTDMDELGETVTSAKYQKMVDMLTKHSVSLTDENGELRDTYSIIKDIAGVWGEMSRNEQAALAEIAAGTRQQNIFTSLILNFREAENAMKSMQSSAGELSSAYSTYMDSIQAHTGQFKASFQELAQMLFDSGIINDFIDGAKEVVNALKPIAISVSTLISNIGGLKGILVLLAGQKIISNMSAIVGTISKIGNFLTMLPGSSLSSALGGLFGGSAGLTLGLSAGVGTLMTVLLLINRIRQAEAQRREDAEEAAKADVTRLDNYQEIATRYQELMSKETLDDSDMQELASLQSQIEAQQGRINTLIGDQAGQIDLVNGKYDEQIAKLNQLIGKQADIARITQEADTHNAIDDALKGFTPDIIELDKADKSLYSIASALDSVWLKMGDYSFKQAHGGKSFSGWLMEGTHSATELREVIGEIIMELDSTDDWRSAADSLGIFGHNQYEIMASLLGVYDSLGTRVDEAQDKVLKLADTIMKSSTLGEEPLFEEGFKIVDEKTLNDARNKLINELLDNREISSAFAEGLISAEDLARVVDATLQTLKAEEMAEQIAEPIELTMKEFISEMPKMIGDGGMLPDLSEVTENISKLYGWLDKIRSGDFDAKDLVQLLDQFPTLEGAANNIEDLSTDMFKLAEAIQATIDAAPNEMIERINNYMDSHLLSNNVKAQLENWKKYVKGLTDLTEQSLPERASKIKDMQSAIYAAAGDTSGLTLEHYNALINLNSKFADAVVMSGDRVVINMDKASKIIQSMAAEYSKAIKEQIDADKKRISDLNELEKKNGSLTDSEERERQSLEQNIQALQALRGELVSTLSAYEKWRAAQGTPNAGSEVDELRKAADYIEKVTNPKYNKGKPDPLFGMYNNDDFKSALALMGKSIEDFMKGGTFDTEAAHKWMKNIKKYVKEGGEGVFNFITDLEKAGLGKIKGDNFSLKKGVTLDDIAKKLKISTDAARTLLELSTNYGFNLDLVDLSAQQAAESVDKVQNSLEKMGKGGNVDLNNRPIISPETLKNAGWEDVGDGIATIFSSTFSNKDFMDNASDAMETVAMNFTPIITDGNGRAIGVLSPQEMADYARDVLTGVREDDLNLKIGATFKGDDAIKRATDAAEKIHEAHEQMYGDAEIVGDMESTSALNTMNSVIEQNEAVSDLLDTYDELRRAEESAAAQERTQFSSVDDELPDIEGIREKLSKMLEEPLDMNAVDSVRESINNALLSLQKDKDTRLALGLDTTDVDAQIASLQQDLDDLEGTVKIKEDQQASADLEAALTTANAIFDLWQQRNSEQQVISVNYDDVVSAGAAAQATHAALNSMAAQGYNVKVNYVTSGSPGPAAPSGSTGGGGTSGAYGGAFANGGNTLVGELGQEIVVDPEGRKWYTVGDHGAEFVRLPKHAIVFNNNQTRALMRNGSTSSRGASYASGTAADIGVGTFKGSMTALKLYMNTLKDPKPKKKYYPQAQKEKKSDEDNWFIKKYKEYNHLINMDKKGEAEYLKWLDGAYKKAYKEKIIKLDDYRKYEEEVYKGLQDLFLDSMDDTSAHIDELMNYSGAGKKIVKYYKDIIKKTQEELQKAYKRGLTDNDDYVQKLKDIYWDNYNALKDYEEGVANDAKDSIEELVRFRMKMISKELEDEKTSLKDRLSDLKDFYDEQKKLLRDSAEDEDYLKEQAKKRKEITDLEIQLAQLAFDTSTKAQKKRFELEEQLAEAREELYTFERDHTIDIIEEEYDKIYDAAEKSTDKQVESIDEKLEDQKYLYQEALNDIRSNNRALYDEMIAYNEKYIDGTGDAVVEMWEKAYEALYEYSALQGKTFDGITLGNFTNWTPLTASSGTLKINNRKYASGTSSARAGVHRVDEIGPEHVFVTANGNRYRLFNGGEKVLNAKATQFLYDFANSGGSIITDALRKSAEAIGNMSRAAASIGSVAMGDIIIQGNATEKTVSEIRRSQRESVDYLLKEFRKLNK